MQRIRYREVEEMGEGAGHHVLWEGKYITQGCAASAPNAIPLLRRNHAAFQTSFASLVVRCAAWRSGALPGPRNARPDARPAPSRRFGGCFEQSKFTEFTRRQQQGPARRAPEKHKKRCPETLRPRRAAKE